jgi:DNA mismatch repair protein MSH6
LRDVEGFDYGKTLEELKTLYPVSDGEDDMDDEVLPSSVPKAIREMLGSRTAVEALGALIW